MDTHFLVYNLYYLLSLICRECTPEKNYCVDILVSILNLLFASGPTLHVCTRPQQNAAVLATELYFMSMLRKNELAVDKTFNKVYHGITDAVYHSYYEYIYNGYETKNIYDIHKIERGWVPAYLNQLLGGFPATLINLFDLIVKPASKTFRDKEHQRLIDFMMRYEKFADIMQNYFTLRMLIWEKLAECVPRIPLRIMLHIISTLHELQDQGVLRFKVPDEVRFFIGDEPYVQLHA